MAFAIRPTYKPRVFPSFNSEDTDDTFQSAEDAQAIISKIKDFTSRSSHENVLSTQDLRKIIQQSSINPDVNSMAKKNVDEIMKKKQNNEKESLDYVNPTQVNSNHGFSSGASDKFHSGLRSAKMEQELKKELDGLRLAKKNKDAETDRNIPDDIAKQISAMQSPSLEPIEENEEAETEEENLSDDRKKKIELNKAKRIFSYSHPARASMGRGFVPRTNGSGSGMGVRKTVLGISDAF